MKNSILLSVIAALLVTVVSCAGVHQESQASTSIPDESLTVTTRPVTVTQTYDGSYDTEMTPQSSQSSSAKDDNMSLPISETVTPKTSAVTPTTESPISTVTTTEPDTPVKILNGKLLENRKYLGEYLPVSEENCFYSILKYVEPPLDLPEEIAQMTICGEEFEFRLSSYLSIVDQDGKGDIAGAVFSTGSRFSFGQRSSFSRSTDGRVLSVSLAKDFLRAADEGCVSTEEELIGITKEIVAQFAPDMELSLLEARVTTVCLSSSGDDAVQSGFQPINDSEYYSYNVDFRPMTGEFINDRGVTVSYTYNMMPLPFVDLQFYYGLDEDVGDEMVRDMTAKDVYAEIERLLPSIIVGCRSATSIYFNSETLLFTSHDGEPAFTVDVVVDMIDGTQIQTAFCLLLPQ